MNIRGPPKTGTGEGGREGRRGTAPVLHDFRHIRYHKTTAPSSSSSSSLPPFPLSASADQAKKDLGRAAGDDAAFLPHGTMRAGTGHQSVCEAEGGFASASKYPVPTLGTSSCRQTAHPLRPGHRRRGSGHVVYIAGTRRVLALGEYRHARGQYSNTWWGGGIAA